MIHNKYCYKSKMGIYHLHLTIQYLTNVIEMELTTSLQIMVDGFWMKLPVKSTLVKVQIKHGNYCPLLIVADTNQKDLHSERE